MRPRSRPRTLERRIAALDLRRVDAESRTVEVSFSSETTGIRSPWSGNPEVLLHEDGAADFSRLEDLGTVLFNHDPDQVIGRPERIRLDLKARKGRARIIFDDDAETERVFQKIRGGSIKGVSVGFRVAEWQLLEEGQTWHSKGGREFRGPMDIAVKWFAFEISVVAVPADAGVGVGRAATERKCSMSRRKTPAEAPAENLEEREVETAVETPEERSIASERERIATITDLFSEFGSRGAAIAADHIRLGTSIGDARKIFVEEWRRDRPPIMLGGPRIDYGTDSREKLVRDATDGLLMRANILRDEKRSRELTHFSSLVELARACLHERGVRTQGLRVVELCQRAMSHTTSDFPKILENVSSKSLLQGYQEAPATWRAFATIASVPDFKQVSRNRLSEAGDLELTPEGAAMVEGTFREAQEKYSLATYTNRIGITRQAIVNDDLQAFTRIPQAMGAAASRLVSKLVYDLLTSASGVGPTMAEDAKALFATDHPSGSNYTSTGTAISTTSLGVAKALMRKQKGMQATPAPLNIMPQFLLVSPDKEVLAFETVTSVSPPGQGNAGVANTFYKQLDVIVEPLLTTANPWYLVANPSQVTGLEVGFLDGVEQPMLIRQEASNILGVEFAVVLDVGAKFLDHRGWYRNAGA